MERNPKKPFFGEDRRIFMAGMLANVTYLMIAAALASNFFEKLNALLKIILTVIIILLVILSVLLYPSVKTVKEKGV